MHKFTILTYGGRWKKWT